jgi:hypothetical protein
MKTRNLWYQVGRHARTPWFPLRDDDSTVWQAAVIFRRRRLQFFGRIAASAYVTGWADITRNPDNWMIQMAKDAAAEFSRRKAS